MGSAVGLPLGVYGVYGVWVWDLGFGGFRVQGVRDLGLGAWVMQEGHTENDIE